MGAALRLPRVTVSRTALPVARSTFARWQADGCPPLLERLSGAAAVLVRQALPQEVCSAWVERVRRARRHWVSDFGGEQFALGRAFYTHLETDRSALYFRDAAASDQRVERHLPGMQALVRSTLGQLLGGAVRPRLGFCGPGVHVFPAGGQVARKGGVVHFDVEGLTPLQLRRGHRAMTLVWMLQPPAWGGGLRLWDSLHAGSEHPSVEQLAAPQRTARYGAGDVLLSDSRRLHQIRPFRDDRDRISITTHAVEVDRGVWECWF